MTDSSAYINAYIETTMGVLHENLSNILQTKTQLKLSNDLLKIKNEEVARLQQELEKVKEESGKTLSELEKSKKVEEEIHALRNKASIADSMTNQFNDVKRQLIEKNDEITLLKDKINKLNVTITELKSKKQTVKKDAQVSPKKLINTKNIVPPPVVEEEKADDF